MVFEISYSGNSNIVIKNGIGTAKDKKRHSYGICWKRQLRRTYNFGLCYDDGRGINKDEKKAFE